MPRLTALAGAVIVLLLGGCTSPITADRLQASVAPTFAHLYVLQQVERGGPHLAPASIRSRAACARTGPGTTEAGAGSDWVCTLHWLVSGPGTPVGTDLDVSVQPDGCWTADGPPAAVGQQTLVLDDGRSVVNPLWQFNGCFDAS